MAGRAGLMNDRGQAHPNLAQIITGNKASVSQARIQGRSSQSWQGEVSWKMTGVSS